MPPPYPPPLPTSPSARLLCAPRACSYGDAPRLQRPNLTVGSHAPARDGGARGHPALSDPGSPNPTDIGLLGAPPQVWSFAVSLNLIPVPKRWFLLPILGTLLATELDAGVQRGQASLPRSHSKALAKQDKAVEAGVLQHDCKGNSALLGLGSLSPHLPSLFFFFPALAWPVQSHA